MTGLNQQPPAILVIGAASDLPQLVEWLKQLTTASVHTAPTCAAAFRQATAHPPDLIVVDEHLPGKAGRKLCAEIRRGPDRRS